MTTRTRVTEDKPISKRKLKSVIRRSCLRKEQFKTEMAAQLEIDARLWDDAKAYKCFFCEGWHLTKLNSKGKTQRRKEKSINRFYEVLDGRDDLKPVIEEIKRQLTRQPTDR